MSSVKQQQPPRNQSASDVLAAINASFELSETADREKHDLSKSIIQWSQSSLLSQDESITPSKRPSVKFFCKWDNCTEMFDYRGQLMSHVRVLHTEPLEGTLFEPQLTTTIEIAPPEVADFDLILDRTHEAPNEGSFTQESVSISDVQANQIDPIGTQENVVPPVADFALILDRTHEAPNEGSFTQESVSISDVQANQIDPIRTQRKAPPSSSSLRANKQTQRASGPFRLIMKHKSKHYHLRKGRNSKCKFEYKCAGCGQRLAWNAKLHNHKCNRKGNNSKKVQKHDRFNRFTKWNSTNRELHSTSRILKREFKESSFYFDGNEVNPTPKRIKMITTNEQIVPQWASTPFHSLNDQNLNNSSRTPLYQFGYPNEVSLLDGAFPDEHSVDKVNDCTESFVDETEKQLTFDGTFVDVVRTPVELQSMRSTRSTRSSVKLKTSITASELPESVVLIKNPIESGQSNKEPKTDSTTTSNAIDSIVSRPFKCKLCNKCYQFEKHLMNHCQKEHQSKQVKSEGQRLFFCPEEGCTSSFRIKESLYKHTQRIHSTNSFACDVTGCDKVFRYRPDLKYHFARIHKIYDKTF